MCRDSRPQQVTLPMNTDAPKLARSFLESAVSTAHHVFIYQRAQLLISELVTNAVLHGAPPITIAVQCHDDTGLQVRVSDGSPDHPMRRRPQEVTDHGRGIELTDLLSDAWGVDESMTGKTVWFVLQG